MVTRRVTLAEADVLGSATESEQGTVMLASETDLEAGTDIAKAVTAAGVSQTVQDSDWVFAVDAVGTDDYVITLTPSPGTPYVVGQVFHFDPLTANTGSATLNVNGIGVETIKIHGNRDLATGDIKARQMVTVVWDGVNFQMVSANGKSGVRYVQSATPTDAALDDLWVDTT